MHINFSITGIYPEHFIHKHTVIGILNVSFYPGGLLDYAPNMANNIYLGHYNFCSKGVLDYPTQFQLCHGHIY